MKMMRCIDWLSKVCYVMLLNTITTTTFTRARPSHVCSQPAAGVNGGDRFLFQNIICFGK